jgi:hypothetical protein
MDSKEYLDTVKNIGFEHILEVPFYSKYWDRNDVLNILWHPKHAILLNYDTFGKDVNSGKIYYNIKPFKMTNFRKCTSSGWFSKNVWVGDHDFRYNAEYVIKTFLSKGKFLNPWVERPFLWLLHYEDVKKEGYDYEKINEERISLLPEYVQEAITP